MISAAIISIGSELLIGHVVNTNAAWLGRMSLASGIELTEVITIGDNLTHIHRSFEQAWATHKVVIVTGGLGPTHDDVSKAAVTAFFDAPLMLNKEILSAVEQRFARFGYSKMPESNISQAMIPAGFRPLRNDMGTAPGLLLEDGDKLFVILPGVPAEMKWIWQDSLGAIIQQKYDGKGAEYYGSRTLLTTGIGESALAELIGPVDAFLPQKTSLAFLPSSMGVRLHLSTWSESHKQAEQSLQNAEITIQERAAQYIYATDDKPLEAVVVELLREKHMTISTAESCTGGLVAAAITSIPGSSDVMLGGIVSYHNEIKISELAVGRELLKRYGAVSEECASAMAEGCRARMDSDIAVSTTGIAGPNGGTEEKPVGLIWIALAQRGRKTIAKKLQFADDRQTNRERAVASVLDLIRRRLSE